jgi:serine O-acetyltransferase
VSSRHGHPLRLLRDDLRASREADGEQPLVAGLAKLLFTTRLQAVILLRIGQWVHGFVPPAAAVVKYLNTVLTGADIALPAQIGGGLRLFHPVGIVVGPKCTLGAGCTLMQGVTLGAGAGGSPTLGDGVFVGPGAVILGALTVGDRSVIGANSVVLSAVPPDVFAAGLPARVIKSIAGGDRGAALSDAGGDRGAALSDAGGDRGAALSDTGGE